MGIFEREFIAVPDEKKDQIVFKWPDVNLRKGSRAIVNADQWAVFISKGQVVGTMGPGQHRIDADEIMGLGVVVDWATGGNAYRAELYFVGTREYAGEPFGGRIDNVQDPQTGNIVTLRVFGEYSYQVIDPSALILRLVGTVDVEDGAAVTDWLEQQLLKVMRTEVTRQIVRNGWPILGLSAFTPEIEESVVEAANEAIAGYGMRIARMGNFDLNLSPEDEATLKALAKDTAYSRLAGGFQSYAAGQALLGAGEGMATGGGAGTQGAFLAAGLGLGSTMMQPQQPGAPVPPDAPGFAGGGTGYAPTQAGGAAPAPGGSVCPNCQAPAAPGAKFCASCGTALGAARFCTGCGTRLEPSARFCPGCGVAQEAAAPAPAAGTGEPTPDEDPRDEDPPPGAARRQAARREEPPAGER